MLTSFVLTGYFISFIKREGTIRLSSMRGSSWFPNSEFILGLGLQNSVMPLALQCTPWKKTVLMSCHLLDNLTSCPCSPLTSLLPIIWEAFWFLGNDKHPITFCWRQECSSWQALVLLGCRTMRIRLLYVRLYFPAATQIHLSACTSTLEL